MIQDFERTQLIHEHAMILARTLRDEMLGLTANINGSELADASGIKPSTVSAIRAATFFPRYDAMREMAALADAHLYITDEKKSGVIVLLAPRAAALIDLLLSERRMTPRDAEWLIDTNARTLRMWRYGKTAMTLPVACRIIVGLGFSAHWRRRLTIVEGIQQFSYRA